MGAPGVLEAGAAYVFERNEGGAENWGEVTKLTASTALPRARFGIVTIRGDAVVVGAPGEASNSGAAYVYQRNQGGGDNWGEVAKLTASDGEAVDAFGRGVAVNADTAFVGASLEDAQGDDAGAAYVFDLLLPKSTPLPPPVGGMAHDSDLRPLPLEVASPGRSVWVMAAVGVAVASLVAGGGAAWYARARKPAEN